MDCFFQVTKRVKGRKNKSNGRIWPMGHTLDMSDKDNYFLGMYQYIFEKDEERKKTMEETWKTVSVPGYLKNMENLLIARGGKHFAGDEVHLIKK